MKKGMITGIGFCVVCFCFAGIVFAQSTTTAPGNKTQTQPSEKTTTVTSGNEASSPNVGGGGGNDTNSGGGEILVTEEDTPTKTTNATGMNITAAPRVKSVTSVKITTTDGKQVKDDLVVSGPVFSADQQ